MPGQAGSGYFLAMPLPAAMNGEESRAWPHGLARYWLCQTVGWGGLYVLTLLVTVVSTAVSEDVDHRWHRDVVFTTFTYLGGFLYTHGLRTLAVRQRWLHLPGRSQGLRFGGAWLAGTGVLCAFGKLLTELMGTHVSSPPLIAYVMMNGLLIGMWICVYVLHHIQEAWTLSKLRESQLRASGVEAQIAALQAQMSPHFLFNALNVIRALVPAQADAAREAITSLADLLRAILVQGRQRGISLAEDLAIMETYLAIERLRFDDLLTVDAQVEPAARRARVPPLLCLTLAENAVKHGLQQSLQGGRLTLTARLQDGCLTLRFTNPCPPANQQTESLGLGLPNLSERVRLIHGEGSHVAAGSPPGTGRFTVSVLIQPAGPSET